MPQLEPSVRARHLQDWLALVEKSEEPCRSRFLERLPGQVRAEIDASSRIAWLPVSMHVLFAELLHETFGAVRAYAFYRRAAGGWLTGPAIGPLVRTGARIFDVTPATAVRWAPRVWDAVFKDCGEIVGEATAPGHARLAYRNLPPVCTASEAWMASAQASAYGVMDVIGYAGVVRLDTSAKSEGRMVLELEWSDLRSQ